MLGLVALVWFAAAAVAGLAGAFVTLPGELPIAIGLAAGVPPLAVLVALRVVPRFRAWAASLDLGLLISLQGWRAGGFVFVVLWAQGLLPGGFALPAGLGDMAVAALAPFVAARPARRAFLAWTALGILDLLAAVTLGVLHSQTEPSMEIVSRLPLSLIPTFAVPFLLVVHLLSLAAFDRSSEISRQGHLVDRG